MAFDICVYAVRVNAFPIMQFPKLCGFYGFQREYLATLKGLGIVSVRRFPPTREIADEAANAVSGRTGEMNLALGEKEAKMEAKLEAKLEDLMWKLNILMFVVAFVLGCVLMYLAMAAK